MLFVILDYYKHMVTTRKARSKHPSTKVFQQRKHNKHTRKSQKKHQSQNVANRLFTAVLHASYHIQKIAPKEGRESWQPIKKQFADESYDLQWKPIAAPIRRFALNMIDETADGKTITNVHYFRQQLRIPSEEALNMRRLLQVALNIGQWKALPKAARDSVIPSHEYKKLRLDTMRRYITRSQEQTLASNISPQAYNFVIDYCDNIRSFPWRSL